MKRDDWRKLKAGMRFTWHRKDTSDDDDYYGFFNGNIGEVVSIDDSGNGTIKNVTTGFAQGWCFNCSDMNHITLIKTKPYKHVPIKHAYFYHSVGD